MARFKLYLEYQGTRYSGWQIQKNARTVQGEISGAFARVLGHSKFELYGAGRTDAGVHALCQVAHLDVERAPQPALLHKRTNDELPADIHILALEAAPPRFHARHQAVARSYLYQISRRKTAFGKRLVWWVKEDLALHRMQQAAQVLVGMKDYQSFSADDPEAKSTTVLVERIQIAESGALVLFRIEGSHFLWKMVRRIVGVLAEAGKGNLTVEQVGGFLNRKSEQPARLAAPASGLFLEKVYYPGDPRLPSLEPVIRIANCES